MKSLSDSGVYEFAIDSKDLIEHLPRRLGKLSEILANNELRITIDAFSEKCLMTGIQKIANRLSLGIIIAATIIGYRRRPYDAGSNASVHAFRIPGAGNNLFPYRGYWGIAARHGRSDQRRACAKKTGTREQ